MSSRLPFVICHFLGYTKVGCFIFGSISSSFSMSIATSLESYSESNKPLAYPPFAIFNAPNKSSSDVDTYASKVGVSRLLLPIGLPLYLFLFSVAPTCSSGTDPCPLATNPSSPTKTSN